MFDPHRTRRSDRRYYTRKGQVLQASRVNVNPVIDQRLVPIYKNYLLKNNLIELPQPPPPPQPQDSITPMGIAITNTSSQSTLYYPFEGFYVSTAQNFRLSQQAGPGYIGVIGFQQKTDGTFRLFSFPFTGTLRYDIKNNTKCYYKYLPISSSEDWTKYPKALYHTSPTPENMFLVTDVDLANLSLINAYISPSINIVMP